MTWLRSRALPLAGILCLAGQGILLFAAGTAAEAPVLPWPGLFLLLTVVLAFILAIPNRSVVAVTALRARLFWQGVSLLAVVTLLGVGTAIILLRDKEPASAPDHSAELDQSVAMVARLDPALNHWWVQAKPILQPIGPDSNSVTVPRRGGDLFRRLSLLPELWPAAEVPLPMGVVLWQGRTRLAWAGEVEPLADLARPNSIPSPPGWARSLTRGREGWILRLVTRLGPDQLLAVQLRLTTAGNDEIAPGVQVVVGPISDPALTMDDSGLLIHQVGFGPADRGPFAHLLARPESFAARRGEVRARWLLVALLAWAVVFLGLTRLYLGAAAAVVALWLGRGLLAGAGALRWVGVAYPDQVFPAAPESWFSLLDPAYFATTFGGGWFASTADAMLTAVVVAVSIWYVLRWRGLLTPGSTGKVVMSAGHSGVSGWRGSLVFGLASGLVLWVLAYLTRMIAENANPRLIGTGVNLGSLSFWGLQIVLMILAFALVALVVGLAATRRWPGRDQAGRWLLGGLFAGAIALLVVILCVRTAWWPARLLAVLVTVCLWLLAPSLLARPRFMRRFAWPLIMLLAAGWNYVSLRGVYDSAERSWLEIKGSQITATDPDWSRYLLGSVLDEMVDHEQALAEPVAAGNLWEDERAWQLFRESALSDLGYNCAVELVDSAGQEASFFALGFLNTPGYEVVKRDPWVDMSGQPVSAAKGMIFRTERRLYTGGQEEVLIAEVERAGAHGWLRLEMPVRSWRVRTLAESLVNEAGYRLGHYQPRAEVDRPVLLLLADDSGWLDTGSAGVPGTQSDVAVAQLRTGRRAWAEVDSEGSRWLCLWRPLPASVARSRGEGFLLGLRRFTWRDDVLDISRLMLLDLTLFFLLFLAVQGWRVLNGGATVRSGIWRPGFQERFLAGYLTLGLVLLVLVGMTVDRVGYERIRTEARTRTGTGLARTVEQLRALLTEQARSLVDSDYIDDLMRGRLAGQRPAGSDAYRQGMVFTADGELLLDETLSDLSVVEARDLLHAARTSPMVVIRDRGELFIGTIIPINLGDWVAGAVDSATTVGHSQVNTNGVFFYRQRLDEGLIASLAELVGGQVILDVDGQPLLASHPAAVFAGQVPLLGNPDKMISVQDHRQGASVFAAPGRPFAFTAGRPLTALDRAVDRKLVVSPHPAVLNLSFPDREREYENQRQQTILFLGGLANLILLTALLLALLMSWNIFRPVRLLLTATRSLAQGDFEAPLPEAGDDEVGRLAGAFGSMRSELQSARDDLAAREQFLATVLARVTVGVAVVDDQNQVVVLNPAGAHILTDFRPEVDEQTGVVGLLQEFRDQGRGAERTAGELVSSDRLRTVRGALAPLELPGGRTDTMLVFEDITEFLTTKKMAINAELARQVAHEIKNPLTPIQLSVQLLRQAWRDQHPQLDRIVPETVDRVLQQVDLLRSIASEFSLLGRPGELTTEAIDLRALVRTVTDAYADWADPDQAGHSVTIAAGDLPPVQAHSDSLRKILGNLMQNSLDAARPLTPLQIRISWRIAPESLTMVWRDNGTGLPTDVADRLFDPYFSTKSKGTGLGLVICRNLADRMHGSISLGNHPTGAGAVAELTLPRASHV